ncbi:MAG TPA: hypothetical protein H9889_00245 [Candidatus Ignatzschineria merdigallinarum]|uniref:Uncharacterized protein n=1 Tax=Candidatus Ignatzschineria merdigallinarum TaxID=2838621 RepID=A0A9D1TT18_9GAMM|nr:hypothetical protein [Candidatus Ignatzschineria merdigallinarum]
MTNEHSQLTKELQHPTSKYDYDGITGTWLLIPAKFHILMLAIAIPVILWMFPFIHLKGNYRYVFADYRYYIAGAVAIFCISSAFLSVVKARQVKNRLRPLSEISRAGVTRSPRNNHKISPATAKHPQINLTQIQKKSSGTQKSVTSKNDQPSKSTVQAQRKQKASSQKSPVAAPNTKAKTASNNSPSKNSAKPQTSTEKVSTPKRKKNPKQMQLDL